MDINQNLDPTDPELDVDAWLAKASASIIRSLDEHYPTEVCLAEVKRRCGTPGLHAGVTSHPPRFVDLPGMSEDEQAEIQEIAELFGEVWDLAEQVTALICTPEHIEAKLREVLRRAGYAPPQEE